MACGHAVDEVGTNRVWSHGRVLLWDMCPDQNLSVNGHRHPKAQMTNWRNDLA